MGDTKRARGERVQLVCECCGKDFERLKCNIKPGKQFCSKECRSNYNKTKRENRTCKQCGKKFEVYKSAITHTNASGNFCCRGCYNKYLTTLKGEKNKQYSQIEVPCAQCGKIIKRIPSKLQMYKNAFCSKQCKSAYHHNYIEGEKNVNWVGGTDAYRGNFDFVKREYFSGTQFCAICGTTKNIHIHHIIPYRITQDNDISNLIPLCRKHHKIIECATKPIFEGVEDKEYAKYLINNILRTRQGATMQVIKGIIIKKTDGGA